MNAIGFQDNSWWHKSPEKQYNSCGKRNIITMVCFGPLETISYGITIDNKFYFEYDIIEPEIFKETIFEYIGRTQIIARILSEIELCKKYDKIEMVEAFELERKNIESID